MRTFTKRSIITSILKKSFKAKSVKYSMFQENEERIIVPFTNMDTNKMFTAVIDKATQQVTNFVDGKDFKMIVKAGVESMAKKKNMSVKEFKNAVSKAIKK